MPANSEGVVSENVLPPQWYAARRREFMDRIGPKAAAILPAAPLSVRSNDVEYPYRCDNDLLYLTGFSEPETVCLLIPGHPEEEFVLFVRPRDPERETWTGKRAGVEGAVEKFGANRAYPIDRLDEKVGELIGGRDRLYYRFGRDDAFNQRVVGWMRQWHQLRPRSGKGPAALFDVGEVVHEMRVRKDESELACMRRAADIAAEAHIEAMRAARPGMFEFEVEALIDSTFRRRGGSGPAYPSIVAAGSNATVLHYTANDQMIQSGDLLLIDAGAEYRHYCSDITRTFPVRGGHRREQREVYELVLESQLAAIAAVRPGATHEEPHQRAVAVLVEGLVKLGLLACSTSEALEKELYKPFYMHRTSHWLGLDVHDVGLYRVDDASRRLEPGMVLTIEPGLYMGSGLENVGEGFRGIGVRIEDDVLVTQDGCEVLTGGAPKAWSEIEAICRGA